MENEQKKTGGNLTDLQEQMKGSDADVDRSLAEGTTEPNPELTRDKDKSEDKDYFAHLADRVDNDVERDRDDIDETKANENSNR